MIDQAIPYINIIWPEDCLAIALDETAIEPGQVSRQLPEALMLSEKPTWHLVGFILNDLLHAMPSRISLSSSKLNTISKANSCPANNLQTDRQRLPLLVSDRACNLGAKSADEFLPPTACMAASCRGLFSSAYTCNDSACEVNMQLWLVRTDAIMRVM